MAFEAKDGITLALGTLGAVLGVINTWNAINQRRVKLRVVPKTAYFARDRNAYLVHRDGMDSGEMGCIEVINLSSFPVPIQEIGFTINGKIGKNPRQAVLQPITIDHQPFARILQPHQSVTGYFDCARLSADIGRAYARTDSDEVAYGSSPALRYLRQRARG
ncbi:hypothetical protein [Terriglobus sp. RCC_193]|uniref:hypothetical protein n=1 Tax=Terriglobus sp. RCC_193 TaxID=3239218 RepID=UPI0035258704